MVSRKQFHGQMTAHSKFKRYSKFKQATEDKISNNAIPQQCFESQSRIKLILRNTPTPCYLQLYNKY